MRIKIFLGVAIILGLIIVLNFNLIRYGIHLASGQVNIITATTPVSNYLSNPDLPDFLRSQVELISEIKEFAFSNLGISYSENYSSIYDQQGKPLMWLLTASKPYKLEAKDLLHI